MEETPTKVILTAGIPDNNGGLPVTSMRIWYDLPPEDHVDRASETLYFGAGKLHLLVQKMLYSISVYVMYLYKRNKLHFCSYTSKCKKLQYFVVLVESKMYNVLIYMYIQVTLFACTCT